MQYMAGYWPSSFFSVCFIIMERDGVKAYKYSKKWMRPSSSHLDCTSLVTRGFMIWRKNTSFLRNTAEKPNGQDRAIWPARVVNRSAGFNPCYPLTQPWYRWTYYTWSALSQTRLVLSANKTEKSLIICFWCRMTRSVTDLWNYSACLAFSPCFPVERFNTNKWINWFQVINAARDTWIYIQFYRCCWGPILLSVLADSRATRLHNYYFLYLTWRWCSQTNIYCGFDYISGRVM